MEARKDVFGERAAGSPFMVYAPGEYVSLDAEKKKQKVFEPVRVWHYAVGAGHELTERWPLEFFKDDRYHLRLYGPNGFFREYAGDANDPEILVACNYETDKTGNVALQILNRSKNHPYNISIVDNAYGANKISKKINSSGSESIVLDLSKSSGWYDFTVRVDGVDGFMKRFAGRVETGKETITDPFMGRSV
jgi:phospholipase C